MTTEPPASADPSASAAHVARRRAARRALLGLAIALWPTLLQLELLPKRLESLRVLAPGGPAGAGARQATPRIVRLPAAAPYFGALREAPPTALEARRQSALPGAPLLSSADLADPLIEPSVFSPPPSGSNPPPVPFGPPPIDPLVTGPAVGPVAPTTNPPLINPNGPPPVGPPLEPPVAPPGRPPVVTPITNPPVVPPGPPGPGPNNPPIGPAGPGPGGPAPGGPGGPTGQQPISGVPEPAAWLQMIVGTGLLGAAMRRRRRLQPATALRARSRA